MRKQTVAEAIACLVQARLNCIERGNPEWKERHEQRIIALVKTYLPSGSGFDAGTYLAFEQSKADKLIFSTCFHHMNDTGMYTGWTEHAVTVRPSFVHGLDITISGPNRRGIKEHIHDAFNNSLSLDAPHQDPAQDPA